MKAQIAKGSFGGSVRIPPSKSETHRALICAALAKGESRIENCGDSQDIAATVSALKVMGAQIRRDGTALVVRGTAGKIGVPGKSVDCGESGSTLRFLIPLFSLCGKAVVFTGHGRLMQRPLSVYESLFCSRGLQFCRSGQSLCICGALQAGEYTLPGDISSQFISGLLFALPLCRGESILHITPPFESRSYVCMTLEMLRRFGVHADFSDENTIVIRGGEGFHAQKLSVGGDASQAAFFAVAGAVRNGVTLTGMHSDFKQADRVIFDILRRCGAKVLCTENSVQVLPGPLSGIRASLADCPDLGPALMVLGTFCKGNTVLTHTRRLRFKESDRIAVMQQQLGKMGAQITADEDQITVISAPLHGCSMLSGCNDHRVVMALTAAALAADAEITIDGAEAVSKSWPDFFSAVRALGGDVRLSE